MSINMTQELVFETDDLVSFEKMLAASVRVLFDSKHYKPKILLEQAYDFNDGRYEDHDWEQPGVIPVGTEWGTIRPECTYHGATFHKILKNYNTREEAARASCDAQIKPTPKRMWIATLYDYTDAYKEPHFSARGHDSLVVKTMEIVKLADTEKFRKEFSHVEPRWFDGTIRHGYRMQWRPHGGFNILDISMIHALYGK